MILQKTDEFITITDGTITLTLDTVITDELRQEGMVRDLTRKIQKMRRDSGLAINDKISLCLPAEFAEFEDYIKSETLAVKVSYGDRLELWPVN